MSVVFYDARGGTTAPVTDSITVSNGAPVFSDLTIAPAPANTNDILVATPTASDPEGDPFTYHYAWTSNGSSVGGDSASLDLSVRGEWRWRRYRRT